MRSFINYIYDANRKEILLWNKKNSDELAVSFDRDIGFPNDLKESIKKDKQLIREVLKYNNICDEESAKSIRYYKIPDSLRGYELSEIQKGIYVQSKLDSGGTTYNVPLFIKVLSPNTLLLEQAILLVLSKHQILRMTVAEDYYYKILPIELFTITKFTKNQDEIIKYTTTQSKCIFNLDGGQLIQTEIVLIENSSDVILNLSHHHILTDAYSVNILTSEIFSAYNELISTFHQNVFHIPLYFPLLFLYRLH